MTDHTQATCTSLHLWKGNQTSQCTGTGGRVGHLWVRRLLVGSGDTSNALTELHLMCPGEGGAIRRGRFPPEAPGTVAKALEAELGQEIAKLKGGLDGGQWWGRICK